MLNKLEEYKQHAQDTIRNNWQEIAAEYTAAPAAPLENVEQMFPFISKAVSEIRSKVIQHLPLIIYQTRQSPPESMAVAIPYQKSLDLYECRLISINTILPAKQQLIGAFSQAIWLLIDAEVLPDPANGWELFEKELVEMTGTKLVKL